MSDEIAIVFDIEKFAVHDGPGIRTVVFLKGCPLRCLWCHNPESQSFEQETMAGENGGPPEIVGKAMTVEEVMASVRKDKAFYDNSGGGLTISGGEPLAHFEFTRALLAAAKTESIHTAVETSGYAPRERIEALLPLVNLWLWDVKAPPSLHEKLVGCPAEPILDNLAFLSSRGASVVLRCPLVPGVNDSNEALRHIRRLSETTPGIVRIDIEPYHPMGEDKNRRLGRTDWFHAPFASDADKARWRTILQEWQAKNEQ
ncbi:MAG: glycyl-radical enzyme activating protein [Kiritimatiellae bacterium]|nr:glycyl-radical enzyme activating protein [Kiritimatiellia bacterium]